MDKCAAIYLRFPFATPGASDTLVRCLAQSVEDAGDRLVATYRDDAGIVGRGKNAGWRKLLAHLDGLDQIVLANAGDLPGKTVTDFLCVLSRLSRRDIAVMVPSADIDTSNGSAAVLNLIAAFRREKWTAAIRAGQNKARRMGRHIGRPPMPIALKDRIADVLRGGAGIRPTARRFNVSPASVAAISHAIENSAISG